jgi:hypothetical protein
MANEYQDIVNNPTYSSLADVFAKFAPAPQVCGVVTLPTAQDTLHHTALRY